jgi:hypothetical protein
VWHHASVSRAIARACEEQVTFIALSGDSRPHFTTIAQFVSALGDPIAPILAAVLAVCDRQGLIGREMFAIDGVKLPSNASKHRRGTHADFERHAEKMERAAEAMLARHRMEDARPLEPTLPTKDRSRVERLQADAAALRTADTLITADAGYHSEANLQALALAAVPALIADNGMRPRDARCAMCDAGAVHHASQAPARQIATREDVGVRVRTRGLSRRSSRAHLRVPRWHVALSEGRQQPHARPQCRALSRCPA